MLSKPPITKISQLSLQKEALSSLYLTELLGLSFDKKTYKEDFDVEKAEKKLLASPLIEEATIVFKEDHHVEVSYKHVTPIARLVDYNNYGVDKEGKIFPIKPFLSPKGLPKIYLGISSVEGKMNLEEYKEKERWHFARECLLELYSLRLDGKVVYIDVSKLEEESLGKNEIVVCIKYLKRKDFLRLSKRNYLNEVANYIILCDKLKEESGVRMIDFRFDSCAFIERF